MARVTADEGYKSRISSKIGSMTSSTLGISVTTDLGTTFPLAESIGTVHHQWVKKNEHLPLQAQ